MQVWRRGNCTAKVENRLCFEVLRTWGVVQLSNKEREMVDAHPRKFFELSVQLKSYELIQLFEKKNSVLTRSLMRIDWYWHVLIRPSDTNTRTHSHELMLNKTKCLSTHFTKYTLESCSKKKKKKMHSRACARTHYLKCIRTKCCMMGNTNK